MIVTSSLYTGPLITDKLSHRKGLHKANASESNLYDGDRLSLDYVSQSLKAFALHLPSAAPYLEGTQ